MEDKDKTENTTDTMPIGDEEKKPADIDQRNQEEENGNIVGGFLFASKEDADIASQEQNAVKYLRSRINLDDQSMLLRIYNNALEARTFQTPIGFQFMSQLRSLLIKKGQDEKDIKPISLYITYTKKIRNSTSPAKKRVEPRSKEEKKIDKFRASVIFNIFLTILVIAMFFITLFSSSPNILNYEKAIVNKYSSWEEELTQRENVVREKELEISKEETQ